MLEARNISYARGGVPLFTELSFGIKRGEMLIVRGANGSGKSTLLRILAGLIQPTKDTVFWDNKTITHQALNAYQQDLLYLGHKLALYPDALLKDQINLWQNVSRETILESLETWGIGSFMNKRISELSQGQQKRLSLSRCGWLKRPLWILDEPHAGLDEEGRSILDEHIHDHLCEGGMVVLATHDKATHSKNEIAL